MSGLTPEDLERLLHRLTGPAAEELDNNQQQKRRHSDWYWAALIVIGTLLIIGAMIAVYMFFHVYV